MDTMNKIKLVADYLYNEGIYDCVTCKNKRSRVCRKCNWTLSKDYSYILATTIIEILKEKNL
jgi:hypothetical protein